MEAQVGALTLGCVTETVSRVWERSSVFTKKIPGPTKDLPFPESLFSALIL